MKNKILTEEEVITEKLELIKEYEELAIIAYENLTFKDKKELLTEFLHKENKCLSQINFFTDFMNKAMVKIEQLMFLSHMAKTKKRKEELFRKLFCLRKAYLINFKLLEAVVNSKEDEDNET